MNQKLQIPNSNLQRISKPKSPNRPRGSKFGAWLFSGAWLLVLGCFSVSAQTAAFPGAVGHGKDATGGRNGSVYRVTTLANSGAGSFRDAVSQPNRIIIFDVGGYITLSSEVAMARNLTIAGQTAPGGGIAIRGAEVSTGSSTNLIIRHVRFRPGSSADSGAHCLNFRGTNGIVDQCSLEFGPWNNVGGVNANQLTIMRSLIADPIGQQFGAHMERLGGNVTWYQNIFANGHNRQPLSKINTVFINNVIYNYEAGYTCGDTSGEFSHDIIGNYFITGPATDTVNNDFYQLGGNQSTYESGNLRDSNEDGTLNGSTTISGEGTALGAPWSPLTPTIPAVTAQTAFRRNVSTAGAWPRDQVDNVILAEVRTVGTGGPNPLPSSQTVTGLGNSGFGTINGGVIPLDTDQDGMPDYWEAVAGSNPNSVDAMIIGGDGYARIENYLNWLAEPHALTTTNTVIDVDLWLYAAGFTNAAPTYILDQPTNGTVTLVSGHIARFTPTANVSGFGGFRFAVVSTDALNFTNKVSLIISALPPPSNLTWRGDGSANTWDISTTANWDNGTTLTTFTSGDNVTFDDSGSNSPAINLAAPITAGTISVLAEQDYTFGGSGFAGGTKLFKVGAGKLTLNNANTFSGGVLINEGIVQLGDGVSLNGSISGNVTNNDTLILANPTSASSAASISGSGEVIKRGAGSHTLSGTQTYTNLTTVEAGTLAFSGTPPTGVISNAGGVTFNPAASLTHSGRIIGPGLVTVSASGQTITLSGSNTFTGGLNVTAGNLALSHNNAAGSGPVTNSSTGLIYVGNGMVITNDLTYTTSTTDLNLRCDSGTGTWAGNVTNLGSGVSFRPGSDGGTLIFTGNALMGARNFIVPRGAVQFSSNAIITATGSATALGRDTSGGNRSLNLTLRDNASLTLGACSIGGGQAGNSVTVTIQNNASLTMPTNALNLHNITRSTAVSTLRLNGGILTVNGFTKSQNFTNVINFNGGILKASASPGTFNLNNFLSANSWQTAYVQSGGAIIHDGNLLVSINQALVHDPALGATPDGGLTKLGIGGLGLNGLNTFTGPTKVLAGTLLCSPGSISNSISIYIANGAEMDTQVSGTFTLSPGRVLSGNGNFNGNFILGTGAVLSPGANGIGRFTFIRLTTFTASSTNLLELNKTLLTNDTVAVWQSLTLGGALIVTNLSGTLAAGDSFKLFDGAVNGAFNTIILPPLDAGLAWTNQISTTGRITVISTAPATPPVFGSIAASGNDLVMSGSNGTPNASFYTLTATNVTLPLANWSRVATNQFDANGYFNLTNPIDPAMPQLFYRLQLP
jgi:autotransporter-associated beta strand protein